MLPPPYRDVWLEWKDADTKEKEAKKSKQNKVSIGGGRGASGVGKGGEERERAQSIHQLLPPPYRDVWLEWKDADTKEKEAKKSKQTK